MVRPSPSQLRAIPYDIEQDYGVRVDLVVVGDTPFDERIGGLVAAARQAAVNAAKWSGRETFSVYGEVEPETVSIYVRDTGVGFDPAAVVDGCQGLSHSIHARLEQLGGSSTFRTKFGEGTDVALSVSRTVVAS